MQEQSTNLFKVYNNYNERAKPCRLSAIKGL